jgi:hypothetical protein
LARRFLAICSKFVINQWTSKQVKLDNFLYLLILFVYLWLALILQMVCTTICFRVHKPQQEERPMNSNINNRGERRFASWTALFVLTVLLFFAPSAVLAQNYEASQECPAALVGSEHTVTVTVTDANGDPATNVSSVAFWIYGANDAWEDAVPVVNGVAQCTYTGSAAGADTIEILDGNSYLTKASLVTTWTSDPQDPDLLACAGSSSQSVEVGGRVILAAKKWVAFRIALCAVDGLDVTNVDRETVKLAGVAPWHSHYKDSSLCPGGKDGVRDLVFKFKSLEIVEALENSRGELEDGDPVDLALTGSLKDGTTLEGEWQAVIKKEGKRHMKKKHKEEKNHKDKKCNKDKVAKK